MIYSNESHFNCELRLCRNWKVYLCRHSSLNCTILATVLRYKANTKHKTLKHDALISVHMIVECNRSILESIEVLFWILKVIQGKINSEPLRFADLHVIKTASILAVLRRRIDWKLKNWFSVCMIYVQQVTNEIPSHIYKPINIDGILSLYIGVWHIYVDWCWNYQIQ